ncbi:ABC transporter substrate-binding protein [Rhodopseudomonas sp. HC1]|uniref:ABC transporter substrate-binding protein n=1 Tax=Rhodopseudomonas infernalis TaxID=2897386 RepID=UPI001EE9062C|nr:ABC transporter substrate-binding protein [Rhodopseudomonas infernalis]MCG6205269.1 ABC transporter substrate-binding protein [Rhodopseudomonas infernalis]
MPRGKITRRDWLKTGAATMAVVSFPAIVRAQSLKSLRAVSLQTDWIYGGPNAGFLVAKEKGYFADQGLDVSINQGKGSGNTAQIVASKAAQFGFADGYVVGNTVSKGAKLKMVAGIYRRNPCAVLVLEGSDVKEPKDLIGKTVGITTGSAQFQQFPAFLKSSGVDPASVRVVNVDGAGAGPALINGQVAAIAGFAQGYIPSIEIRGKKNVRPFWYSDAGLVCMSNGLIVHDDMLSEPDVIRGMVLASVKGFLYGRAHPDELTQVVKKYLESTDPAITLREAQLSWSTWVTPTSANKPLGWMPPEDWASTVAVLKANAGVTTALEPAALYTNDFVPTGREFVPPQSV